MKIFCNNEERANAVVAELKSIREPAEAMLSNGHWVVVTTEEGFRRWRL